MQVDSKELLKGSKLSQKDLGKVKREMQSMLTPAEKMEISLKNLGAAAEKDSRFQGAYNLKLKQYNTLLDTTGAKMKTHGTVVKNYSAKWKAAGTSLSGAILNMRTLGTLLVGGAIARGAKRQAEKLDELGKVSRALGVDVEFLSALQFRASQDYGLSYEQTTAAFEKMTIQVGRGTLEMGRARTVLEKYNINLADFKGLKGEGLFRALSDSMQGIVTEQDKMVVGSALFGDKMARLFQLMQDIDSVDLKPVVTKGQVANAEDLIDSMGEMANVWDQFASKAVTVIGPTFQAILTEMTTILNRLFPDKKPGEPINRKTTFDDSAGGVLRTYGETAERITSGDIGAFFTHGSRTLDNIDEIKQDRIAGEGKALTDQQQKAQEEAREEAKRQTELIRAQNLMMMMQLDEEQKTRLALTNGGDTLK